MDRIAVRNRIVEIISDVTTNEKEYISITDKFFADLGMDSLEILTVGSEIETSFEIKIQDHEIESVGTVNDLIEIVVEKLNITE